MSPLNFSASSDIDLVRLLRVHAPMAAARGAVLPEAVPASIWASLAVIGE